MNKKSVIVLLVILLLLSFGYIVYDKVVVQRDIDKQIKELKDQINNLTNTKEDDSKIQSDECPKYMEAEFYGELIEDKGDYIYNVKEVLKLHSNGKFENYYENSGYAVEGTYVIENGKITLKLTGGGSMENEVTVGSTSTYEITNNCSTIIKDGDVKTLTKK